MAGVTEDGSSVSRDMLSIVHMSLTPGTRIGGDEILEKPGEGGPPSPNAAGGRSYGRVSPKPSMRTR
jgi:hypothetical protein